jgi:hypothetical protein
MKKVSIFLGLILLSPILTQAAPCLLFDVDATGTKSRKEIPLITQEYEALGYKITHDYDHAEFVVSHGTMGFGENPVDWSTGIKFASTNELVRKRWKAEASFKSSPSMDEAAKTAFYEDSKNAMLKVIRALPTCAEARKVVKAELKKRR